MDDTRSRSGGKSLGLASLVPQDVPIPADAIDAAKRRDANVKRAEELLSREAPGWFRKLVEDVVRLRRESLPDGPAWFAKRAAGVLSVAARQPQFPSAGDVLDMGVDGYCVLLCAAHDLAHPERKILDPTANRLRSVLCDLKLAVFDCTQETMEAALAGLREHLEREGMLPGSGSDSREFYASWIQHSPDFATVVCNGVSYDLTPNQAACVRILHDALLNGTPTMRGPSVLSRAEVLAERLVDVFRLPGGKRHPAWRTLVVSPSKGKYRLATEAPKISRKNRLSRKSPRSGP